MTYLSIHTLCVSANYFYYCKLKHDYCVKFLNVSKLLLLVIINSDDLNTIEYSGYDGLLPVKLSGIQMLNFKCMT